MYLTETNIHHLYTSTKIKHKYLLKYTCIHPRYLTDSLMDGIQDDTYKD